MICTYWAIFREANRQEKQLLMRQGNAMLMHRHSSGGGTNGNGNVFFKNMNESFNLNFILIFKAKLLVVLVHQKH